MIDFSKAFTLLTGHEPFPWQECLYQRFVQGEIDELRSCSIPTGLGKTSVIPIWLIALAEAPTKVPRRLVYVVNRRTVVDQATREAEKLRENLGKAPAVEARLKALCAMEADSPLAISTLRGQFADNAEWRNDPTRPAVIVGTVDMIGSRLLFSGYGCGFRTRPLHAGFLGQDALLIHDEAHLEPAFQKLLMAIHDEQERCKEFSRFRVVELSATSRGEENPFELTEEEKNPPESIPDPPTEPIHHVWRRQRAKKTIHLYENADPKKLADQIADLAKAFGRSGRAILVFARTVENVEKVAANLRKAGHEVETLTGSLRGKERDGLVDKPVFRRFLPGTDAGEHTVYLVCTSAGEVGVDISADHLVCDLTTFDSMAQRFGRVNRFGNRKDTEIHVVYPKEFDEKNDLDSRLKMTLDLLRQLEGDGCPAALGKLDSDGRLAAYAAAPTILPTSDILFDAWALTTIRSDLPGRPPVEPYLHGLEDSQMAETYIAWREEVWLLRDAGLSNEQLTEILNDYPLKPHELLRDSTYRKDTGVQAKLAELAEQRPSLPVWVQDPNGGVRATILEKAAEPSFLPGRTVILPPEAGGLRIEKGESKGLLDGSAGYDPENRHCYDVADEWYEDDDRQRPRRKRVWDDEPAPRGMRLVLTFDTRPDADDEEDLGEALPVCRFWRMYVRPRSADDDGSRASRRPVLWEVHTRDTACNIERIIGKFELSKDLRKALVLAARFHDLGKKRDQWQRSIRNPDPSNPWAKSGGRYKRDIGSEYRHEFGSLLDVQCEPEFAELSDDVRDLVLHLIATHHGYARPHFPVENAIDPQGNAKCALGTAIEIPRRFARLQRKYGRWGLAYLESLVRAADYAASANASAFVEHAKEAQM